MANYDVIGDIAIIKFGKEVKEKEKREIALEFLKQHKNVRTVLEKSNKVSGRLRTIKTRFLGGENRKETIHKESGCEFKLNVSSCYFSPRLSNERLEVAKFINQNIGKKKNCNVLVMFSGVAPYPIVISKFSPARRIVAVELGKECCRYAKLNVMKNNAFNVEVIQGDVKKVIKKGRLNVKGNLVPLQFDFIIMPRPNLSNTFLKEAFYVCKKNSIIVWYGFSSESGIQKMLASIHKEAKKYKKKIKILSIKEAGDIAPHEHRYRIEILIR